MNFSIVAPGECNAKCPFCIWKSKAECCDNYLGMLKRTLDKVCKKLINLQHFEINITGGEPCMSPYINDILKLLRERRMWFEKIVLTTNGSFLMDNWENIINTVQK